MEFAAPRHPISQWMIGVMPSLPFLPCLLVSNLASPLLNYLNVFVGYQSQRVQTTQRDDSGDIDLSDDDLVLASAVVYGFSLTDKIWCKSD